MFLKYIHLNLTCTARALAMEARARESFQNFLIQFHSKFTVAELYKLTFSYVPSFTDYLSKTGLNICNRSFQLCSHVV